MKSRRARPAAPAPVRPTRMYTTCTFCYAALGGNDELESFAVGRRVAFDPAKGCVWAVCAGCGRWNLAPLEERWEVVEECERRFRATALRYSSGNIGLGWLGGEVELIRVGKALRPEVAAWRYGRVLVRRRPLATRVVERGAMAVVHAATMIARSPQRRHRDPRALLSHLLVRLRGSRVLDLVHLPPGEGQVAATDIPLAVVRYRHLAGASLVRPEPGRAWALHIPHDLGVLAVEGEAGVRVAARLLSVINGTERAGGFRHEVLERAVRKVDDSAHPDSYFNRVLAIALRTRWGRVSDGGQTTHEIHPANEERAAATAMLPGVASEMERMAFRLTGRTFWANGGIGSEPATALLDVPLVDRLALEMAAHEETERRALAGELAELEAAWREADEIATIADALLPG